MRHGKADRRLGKFTAVAGVSTRRKLAEVGWTPERTRGRTRGFAEGFVAGRI